MIQTLKKQVKWRKDINAIFICDCKRLIDLKISLEDEGFMRKLSKGILFSKLNEKERLIFSDFNKMNLLTNLEVINLPLKDFTKAMDILNKELGKDRVRDSKFLRKKFNQFPEYFMGIYLGEDLVGVVCGFPREDYLLISEIAIDSRFQNRGFGRLLIEVFEKKALKDYKRIHVGSLDNQISFYEKLKYKHFILAQFDKNKYSKEDFSEYKIKEIRDYGVELYLKKCDLNELEFLRKKFPKAQFQYIFYKEFN